MRLATKARRPTSADVCSDVSVTRSALARPPCSLVRSALALFCGTLDDGSTKLARGVRDRPCEILCAASSCVVSSHAPHAPQNRH